MRDARSPTNREQGARGNAHPPGCQIPVARCRIPLPPELDLEPEPEPVTVAEDEDCPPPDRRWPLVARPPTRPGLEALGPRVLGSGRWSVPQSALSPMSCPREPPLTMFRTPRTTLHPRTTAENRHQWHARAKPLTMSPRRATPARPLVILLFAIPIVIVIVTAPVPPPGPGVGARLTQPPPFATNLLPRGAVAQLGERLNGIQEVVGSIPIGSTRLRSKLRFELRPGKPIPLRTKFRTKPVPA